MTGGVWVTNAWSGSSLSWRYLFDWGFSWHPRPLPMTGEGIQCLWGWKRLLTLTLTADVEHMLLRILLSRGA